MTDAELRDELDRARQPFGGEQAAIARDERRRRSKPAARGAARAAAEAPRAPHRAAKQARRRPARMTRAAEIVHRAIAASGGLGEPWCCGGHHWPDSVRVGNWLMVVETDCDTYGASAGSGWVITTYSVPDDGGAAAPVAVLVEDNGDAIRPLASLIRQTGRPQTWRRIRPGLYRAGQYIVGQLDTGEWFAEGPGVDQCFDHKTAAQAACDSARGVS